MPPEPVLTSEQIEGLRRLNTCQVSDAIDALNVRLRNEGYMDASIHHLFPSLPPMVGYAATARIRTAEPPMAEKGYLNRTDWWNYILTVPAPRVVVIEDLDRRPGRGSCAGEIHSHIYRALGCVGLVTNGAVRDLEGAESIGFCLFAGSVTVSRAYYHMVEFGAPVEVGNLKVRPGNLLHGDRHGVLSVPPSIAGDIPRAAARVAALERSVLEITDSPNPSLDALRNAVRESVKEDMFRG
jgi:4-hydroxy-4-methyl-2-oxoglutarate aldolase